MYTQLSLHAACETFEEPEAAQKCPVDTRTARSQVASQDRPPGPGQHQHCVHSKTTAFPARGLADASA